MYAAATTKYKFININQLEFSAKSYMSPMAQEVAIIYFMLLTVNGFRSKIYPRTNKSSYLFD